MRKISILFLLLVSPLIMAENIFYLPINKTATGRYSHGAHTQASWLLGKYSLELALGEAYGRALVGNRLRWSWKDDATYHGILGGMMKLKDLKSKYPALYQRFINLKPEYMHFEVSLRYNNGQMTNKYDHGKSKISIELSGDEIGQATANAHKDNPKTYFSYYSPEWKDLEGYRVNKIAVTDLRYIGRRAKTHSTLVDNATSSEFNLSYAKDVTVTSVNIREVRWPDREMQDIFRTYMKNEYTNFNNSLKTSRSSLAKELSKDSDHRLFWNNVNIDLDKYETRTSNQEQKMQFTLKKANERKDRDRKLLLSMIEKVGYSYNEFSSAVFSVLSRKGHLKSIISNNLREETDEHFEYVNGRILISRKKLRRVVVYTNDVIAQRAKKDGSRFNSVVLYNHGLNEIRTGLIYSDGMELVHRQYINRFGDKTPLRATLIWDFDNDEYKKSDIDIALSRSESCREEDLMVYHEKKELIEGGQLVAKLNVDNKEGFGPENISIFDELDERYFHFCLSNYTNDVPANAQVVIFKDEIIQAINDNYIYDYEFESGKRKWRAIPGTYDIGR